MLSYHPTRLLGKTVLSRSAFQRVSVIKFTKPMPKLTRSASSTSQSQSARDGMNKRNMTVAYYVTAVATLVFGVSYASVPLYKVFCSMTGFGGTTQRADDKKASTVKPVSGGRVIKVTFESNVHSEMPWQFKPTQRDVKIIPGETALAFYTVKNPSDKAISGVATYNVFPSKSGLYFNKIQCFCFEEQRLGPKEEIDMPVFFYIDPDFVKDPAMDSVNNIVLSYTFFKTGEEEPVVSTAGKETVIPAPAVKPVVKAAA